MPGCPAHDSPQIIRNLTSHYAHMNVMTNVTNNFYL